MAKPTKINLNMNEDPVKEDTMQGELVQEEALAREVIIPQGVYQFAHGDKFHYIPARNNKSQAIQFIRGKYSTNDEQIARYVSVFDGVVCLSDNLED